MARRGLGLEELMIVNPGPVGARPCVFTPLRRVESPPRLGCPDCGGGCGGGRSPGLLLGSDGRVYRAVGRAVPLGRPGGRR